MPSLKYEPVWVSDYEYDRHCRICNGIYDRRKVTWGDPSCCEGCQEEDEEESELDGDDDERETQED